MKRNKINETLLVIAFGLSILAMIDHLYDIATYFIGVAIFAELKSYN
jgi:hypothetical protein